MITLVEDKEGVAAKWGFEQANAVPMLYNCCIGVLENDMLKGAIAFTGYNGSEIEVHYFGPGTLKRHVLLAIFKVALLHYRVNRLVVRTRKASMSRGVKKLGAIFEGKFKRVYGPTDGDEHAAHQWVFFKERLAEILKLEIPNVRR